LVSAQSHAWGAGIYTAGDLTLTSSVVTKNHAVALSGAPYEIATGGGAWVNGTLYAKYTTFSENTAYQLNSAAPDGRGGALYTTGTAQIESSTFAGNTSNRCGGIKSIIGPLVISNSTISGNTATRGGGGICGDQGVTLLNSTVAFNTDSPGSGSLYGSGIAIWWNDATLESTIVANNAGSSDIGGSYNRTVFGSHNLVTSSELALPGDTLRTCAKLDQLADNGGPTHTHALLLGSVALDHGSNDTNLVHDQRGGDRVAGPFPDIGAFERQTGAVDERIFADDFEDSSDCSP